MQVDVINAEAARQAAIITNNATANITKNSITYQGWSYDYVQQKIGITNSSELLDYIYYMNLMSLNKNDPAKLVVNLNAATFTLWWENRF